MYDFWSDEYVLANKKIERENKKSMLNEMKLAGITSGSFKERREKYKILRGHEK